MKRVATRGLTIVDCAVAVAFVGALLALAATGLSRSRLADGQALCIARLGAIGAGNGQFALANLDLMAGFTWQQGGANSQYPDLNQLQSFSLMGAHAAQAIDILRRRGESSIPVSVGWAADIEYWSLALGDFEDRPLSDQYNICGDDPLLSRWRKFPHLFNQGRFLPYQPAPTAFTRRMPYCSSYTITGSAIDRSQSMPGVAHLRLRNILRHNLYSIPAFAAIGPSTVATVAFPSQKSHVFDTAQRHGGPALYHAFEDASVPVLFFDGSVSVRRSGDAVTPWEPNNPESGLASRYAYVPALWEAHEPGGMRSYPVEDQFRWTRDGLLGRDFTP